MRTVGIVTPFVWGVFFGNLLTELMRQAPGFGFQVLTLRTGDWKERYRHSVSLDLAEAWIDVVGSIHVELAERIVSSGRPIVTLAHSLPGAGISSVQSDNEAGVTSALDWLAAQGHRTIGFLGDPSNKDLSERERAFRRWNAGRGLSDPPVVLCSSPSLAQGWEAARQLLEIQTPVTALLAGNDQLAVGALQGFRSLRPNRPPPTIVGYDNSAIVRQDDSRLSSVDQQIPELVRQALLEVQRRLDQPRAPAKAVRVVPRLVVRLETVERETDPYPALPDLMSFTQESLNYSSEIRFLTGENTVAQVHSLLILLNQLGRNSTFATVEGDRYREGDSLQPLSDFGQELLARAKTDGTSLFILPCQVDVKLSYLLAVSVPYLQTQHPASLGLVAHELELTVLAIERATYREYMERLVAERTRELHEAQAELVRSAQLSVLGPIVTGVTHHLNTPLGNSLLTSSAMRAEVAGTAQAQALVPLLDVLDRNLQRMKRLVDNFGRATNLPLGPSGEAMDCLTACRQTVETYRVRAGLGKLQEDWPDEGVVLEGPVEALTQVLAELLDNALDHGLSQGPIAIRGWKESGMFRLSVHNGGPGVDPSIVAKMIEPFYTTRLADRTGLGLTLVQNVVTKLFHGQVSFSTGQDQGFTVCLELPLAAP